MHSSIHSPVVSTGRYLAIVHHGKTKDRPKNVISSNLAHVVDLQTSENRSGTILMKSFFMHLEHTSANKKSDLPRVKNSCTIPVYSSRNPSATQIVPTCAFFRPVSLVLVFAGALPSFWLPRVPWSFGQVQAESKLASPDLYIYAAK